MNSETIERKTKFRLRIIDEIKLYNPNLRAILYYYAIPLLQFGSAIAGLAYLLNDSRFLFAAGILFIAWFMILFAMGIPGSSKFLSSKAKGIKKGALIIFIVMLAGALVEGGIMIVGHNLPVSSSPSASRQVITALSGGLGYNDSSALSAQAAENLLKGKNPYENSNIVTAMSGIKVSPDKLTPLRAGSFADVFPYPTREQIQQEWLAVQQNPGQPPAEFASTFCYPAGDFLLAVPFFLVGITDLRLVYLIFVLLAAAYVIYLLPSPQRYFFIGALIISLELWSGIGFGDTATLVFPFLLLGWVLIRKNMWLSALFMGIAVTTKQTAWFFLPFYLIAVLKTYRFKKAGLAAAVISGIFLAANLPFIIINYSAWFNAVIAPASGSNFPSGIGVITLVVNGILNIRSPLIFNILEFTLLGIGAIWYFRHYRTHPQLGPVLAMLPIFFAWRSLSSYFLFNGLIVLALVLGEQVVSPGVGTSSTELEPEL